MERELSILYRGPLSSCNYDCVYCPFAKRHETAEELRRDRLALRQFVEWVCNHHRPLRLFFTPWGEALTRRWYHEAIERLLECDHVARIAVQTNLSWVTDAQSGPPWMTRPGRDRVALWCTWHPSQTDRSAFLERCRMLDSYQIPYSTGMVAIPENYPDIQALRRELPKSVYLWLNAWDIGDGHKFEYSTDDRKFLEAIDPEFGTNALDHPSLGYACRAGSTVISVDGDGTVRRCHFVSEPVGNLYVGSWHADESPTACPNESCGCFIGYVHMPHLAQHQRYGDRLLERIPLQFHRD